MSTTTRPRDTQRSKVYAAENAAFGRHRDGTVDSVAEMQAFIDKVCSYAWFKRRSDLRRPPTVHDGRGRTSAAGNEYGLWMPRQMRSKWVLLHELAHSVTIRQYGYNGVAAHGWEFCAIYLDLVRFTLGPEAHAKLKAEFKAKGVRYTAPRKGRPLTPEQRAAAVGRLAAARAARTAANVLVDA